MEKYIIIELISGEKITIVNPKDKDLKNISNLLESDKKFLEVISHKKIEKLNINHILKVGIYDQ